MKQNEMREAKVKRNEGKNKVGWHISNLVDDNDDIIWFQAKFEWHWNDGSNMDELALIIEYEVGWGLGLLVCPLFHFSKLPCHPCRHSIIF
jgi:hypothetical protein